MPLGYYTNDHVNYRLTIVQSIMRRAKKDATLVLVSIYVNIERAS